MPEHLADLLQPGTGAQHLGRRAVTQAVGVHLGEPRTGARGTHDRRDAAGAEPAVRGADAGEDLPGGTARPAASQPSSDRLARLDRERQALDLRALAPHDELSSSPVDVVEAKAGDLTGAKAQATQQRQDGEVAPSERGSPVAAAEQGCHVAGIERPRQRGEPPGSHRRHGVGEVPGRSPLQVAEAEEAPQSRDDVLRRADAPTPGGPCPVSRIVTVQGGAGVGIHGSPSNSRRKAAKGLMPCLRAVET